MSSGLSVIIPCLNEAAHIGATLSALQGLRSGGAELILVDGGSTDRSVALAKGKADLVVSSLPGRAIQMNAGASRASGRLLWFLHADTIADINTLERICQLADSDEQVWGRFRVRIDHPGMIYRCIAFMMNSRSCLTAIATGDQGIFVSRELFEQLGGFAEIPLMEDIEISKRLKKRQRPLCCDEQLTTSSRRWQNHGVLRTIGLMWTLRTAYALGVSPATLALRYRR